MIHRYNPGHGKGGEYMGMEEDPEGHWCAHEDVVALEKQAADFRASSQAHHERALRETDRCTALERDLAAERAAHEATKAERDRMKATHGDRDEWVQSAQREQVARIAAESRVAELERDIGAINNEWHAETMRKLKAEAALDQARKLLEQVEDEQRTSWYEARHHWLRAHPATTAAMGPVQDRPCPGCGKQPSGCPEWGDECWLNNGCPATPAATGAERVNAFILREVKDGAIDNPGGVFAMLVERAEKEQGT